MRHHRLSWSETGTLRLDEVEYLLDLIREFNDDQKKQQRQAERKSRATPGVRLEPVIT